MTHAAPTSTRESGGTEAILVVEDDAQVRTPICRKLRLQGYLVLEAHDGEDALQVLQAHHAPVHLVISDVVMPAMNGAELAALLRSWYPHLRILFISGQGPRLVESTEGELMPGTHFMAKPFTPDELAIRVREVLDSDWDAA